MRLTSKLRAPADIDGTRPRASLSSAMTRSGVAAGRKVLDALLPPRCVACGQEIDAGHGLCADCWGNLTFIETPMCERCGLPFDFEVPSSILCGPCLARPPTFDRARAALIYDGGSRSLILGFKHGDRTDRAVILSRLMTRLLADLGDPPDLIVPVPLHRWRLWRRRYNQSALLAQALNSPWFSLSTGHSGQKEGHAIPGGSKCPGTPP